MPPTPFTRRVAPMRSRATSVTSRAKNAVVRSVMGRDASTSGRTRVCFLRLVRASCLSSSIEQHGCYAPEIDCRIQHDAVCDVHHNTIYGSPYAQGGSMEV